MLSVLAKLILHLTGWKIGEKIPVDVRKCIIIMAPHTSNWDFVIGRLAYFKWKVKVRILIKKEAFFFPIGGLLKRVGGIPIDRSKNNRVVDQITTFFNESESMYIVIYPEGTRKPNPHWKRGFYYIAQQANVPIALGYMDYKKKEGGIGGLIYPNGDIEGQMKEIKDFYRDKVARHPENFKL